MVNLRQILRHNQGTPRIDNLKDSALFKIYDTIFQAIDVEVTQLRACKAGVKSKTTVSATELRLTSCSTTLRVAVEVGIRNVRSKSVKALIDHFITNFDDADGTPDAILSTDYARNLSVVLGHEPHVEHLSQDLWKATLNFCLDKMKLVPRSDHGLGSSILTPKSSRSHFAPSQAGVAKGMLPRHAADDLVNVFRSLVSVPFAPLLPKGSQIVNAMAQFLHNSPHTAKPQIDALVVINTVLLQIRTEDVAFTKNFTRDALILAKVLWNTKLSALKDEILSMLILLHPFIEILSQEGENGTLFIELSNLVDTFKGEYTRRPIKDQLQISQLNLQLDLKQPYDGLRGRIFGLQDGQTISENTLSAEHNWTFLKLLAHFSVWSHPSDKRSIKQPMSPDASPQKRQRVARWSDELSRMLSDFSVANKLCSLQIVCFTAQSIPIEEEILGSLLEKLATCITDDNSFVAGWACLALAR